MTKAEAQNVDCPEMKALRRQSLAADRYMRKKARELLGDKLKEPKAAVLPVWPPKAPPFVQTDLQARWVRLMKRDVHKARMKGVDALQANITTRDIIIAVSRETMVGVKDILSTRRTRHIVDARHLVFYLARKMTSLSMMQIGKRVGGRDHSTIHHAVTLLENRVETDRAFSGVVEEMTYAVLVQAEDRQSY